MEELEKWWENNALLITEGFAPMWSLYSIKTHEIPKLAEKYYRTGANTIHLGCMELGKGCGTNYEKPIFKITGNQNIEYDLLGLFISEFHKLGIRVIMYFNGHSFVPQFFIDHPSWVQIYEDGSPALDIYGTGASACPNNPGFKEWQANIIKDLCEYEIDGVFLDGNIFFQQTCFCDICKNKFKNIYNFELPSKKDRNNPNWRYLREFQIDSMTDYVAYLYNALKDKRPQALLYCNSGLRAANWATGRQNRRLVEVEDILISEGGFLYGNLNEIPIWRTECENKLCVSQSMGKPVVSGIAMDHKSWNWYQLPSIEYKLMMYGAIATGSHVYAGMSSPQNNIEGLISNLNTIFSFIKQNKNYFYPTKSLAKVAIIWSNITADYYGGGNIEKTDFTSETLFTDVGDLHKEFGGFYELCFQNGIPVDVLDEISITDGSLKNYDLVILPNIACVSSCECTNIKNFVKDGGTLLSTFETSMYNEYGEITNDLMLKDVFGISLYEKKSYGPLTSDYIMPVPNAPYMDSFDDYKYLPAPKYIKKTISEKGKSILDLAELLEGGYDDQPNKSNYGFCYLNNYGKGKSIYFAGTIGQALFDWRFPEYFNLLNCIIVDNSRSLITLKNAPLSVSLNIRENLCMGEILIYLVNYTSPVLRPITQVIELENIQIKINFKIKKARSLCSKDNLEIRHNKNSCTLNIKKLKGFEAIVLTN